MKNENVWKLFSQIKKVLCVDGCGVVDIHRMIPPTRIHPNGYICDNLPRLIIKGVDKSYYGV